MSTVGYENTSSGLRVVLCMISVEANFHCLLIAKNLLLFHSNLSVSLVGKAFSLAIFFI